MNRLRVVLDTNVIVSGLLFGGVPLQVVHVGLSEGFVWVTSPNLIQELERVLRSKKFGLTTNEIETLLEPILYVTEIIHPISKFSVITRTPADNRVLECAFDGKCHYLVTGDRRDLLILKDYKGVQIVAPKRFLEIANSNF